MSGTGGVSVHPSSASPDVHLPFEATVQTPRALLTILTGLAAAGCGTTPSAPPNQLRDGTGLTVVAAAWNPTVPNTIGLTVTNGAATPFYFNPCHSQLERLDQGQWVEVPGSRRICPTDDVMLNASDTFATSADLPVDLAPGHYRLNVRFVETPLESSQVVISSNDFTVTE